MKRVSEELVRELQATGLPYEIRERKRHLQIVLAGEVIAVWPHCSRPMASATRWKNSRAQIRRKARELKR
jgi:hypothetical protein